MMVYAAQPERTATYLKLESGFYRRFKFASCEAKAKENFQKLLFPDSTLFIIKTVSIFLHSS